MKCWLVLKLLVFTWTEQAPSSGRYEILTCSDVFLQIPILGCSSLLNALVLSKFNQINHKYPFKPTTMGGSNADSEAQEPFLGAAERDVGPALISQRPGKFWWLLLAIASISIATNLAFLLLWTSFKMGPADLPNSPKLYSMAFLSCAHFLDC
jgi:hypothetical protein